MKATLFVDVTNELEIPSDGTLSRVLFKDDDLRVVLFGFDTGQELTEHTASKPAVVQIVSGSVRFVLGDEESTVGAGGWAHMPARLPHSVQALEPTIMLLTLLNR